jgi:hypothetical protein
MEYEGMADAKHGDRSGGIKVTGGHLVVGHMAGGDQTIIYQNQRAVDEVLNPVVDVLRSAPEEVRAAANEKISQLKTEAAKGKAADDGKIARLIDGIVALVPDAVGTLVSAFGLPILSNIAGSATNFVLEKLRPNRGETEHG